jgi:hypothetical protein
MYTPPRGNLVRNGDFECGIIGAPPDEWISTNVTLTDDSATGIKAASIGQLCPSAPAVIYQDITIYPMRRYLLTFSYGSHSDTPGEFTVQVKWLDSRCLEIGTGLCLFVGSDSTPCVHKGNWATQIQVTGFAPANSCMARLLFTRSPSLSGCGPTLIDTVTFANTA